MTKRKARVEGAASPTAADERTPAEYASALKQATEAFRERFPEEWEALRLCPLVHGLEEMVRLLG